MRMNAGFNNIGVFPDLKVSTYLFTTCKQFLTIVDILSKVEMMG